MVVASAQPLRSAVTEAAAVDRTQAAEYLGDGVNADHRAIVDGHAKLCSMRRAQHGAIGIHETTGIDGITSTQHRGPRVRRQLRRWLPTPESLQSHRTLRWLGPLLRRPWLWQLNRRGVALGAAIGVFFGVLVPLLQIALAAVFAIALRANLPVAAATTLVSNPLTYAPIWVAAYRTGAAVLEEKIDSRQVDALAQQMSELDLSTTRWRERLQRIGKPLAVGLAIFAVVGAAFSWAAVHLAWIAVIVLRRRRRVRRAPPA
jgi:uncharacterized protein